MSVAENFRAFRERYLISQELMGSILPYDKAVAAEEFQCWKLQVRAGDTATLSCEDGNGNAVFSKEIEFTDFPLDAITLYFANNVIHLPSEY